MTRDGHRARRRRPLPPVSYPDTLPITRHRDEIVGACRDHPVVIVAGETGSGKTTQLPKMLMELGCGTRGMVGCTQPRRIAATSVAARVAEELGGPYRRAVGHQVRFDNRTGRDTVIKFMTDGILLTETQTDCRLRRYDALIIDEVHERTLNIDFLLGYLKRLLPRRRDMRLVISSATLDVARFSDFFGGAPVIEVPGRTYPVEVFHRQPEDEDFDLAAEAAAAVEEIAAMDSRGDILLFLTGERDIRETARLLEGRRLPNTEIVPLYARLPAAQQRRAFVVGGRRRIILATNVAETSVTIPGIRVVVDAGLARVKRYNPRTQVEKLHIEPISQASADQRKGRCGRVGPGVCLRLFDEKDLAKRPPYTDPEIKRSSLASVILTMLHLELGRVERFPFLDPPSPAAIKDGYRELRELGAIDEQKHLTPLGRKLCRFSLEPRLARMLVEAHRRGVLSDVLTVVAALSSDDPRLRPLDHEEEADRAHAQYAAETSDFSTLLKLWRSLQEAHKTHRSRGRFRTYCRERFLSYRRVREWESVREQLKDECRDAGLKAKRTDANEEKLHRSVLAGLLNKIGVRQERSGYRGARGVTFLIHPGSILADKRPEWVVAAELVETSRLFGRYVGTVQTAWIEQAGRHLCRYRYGPPFWDEKTGFVRAEETVLLYGIPLAHGRRRHFGPINPEESRRIFIQQALVEGLIHAPPPVIRGNLEAIRRVEAMEARIRKRDILATDQALFDFYDRQLPPHVYSTRALKEWLRDEPEAARTLTLTEQDLMTREPDEITQADYPDHLDYQGHRLHLRYRFRRGEEEDGITCVVPLPVLQDLPAHPFDWLVSGLRPEKVHALLKGLPKRFRRELVPLNRTVEQFLSEVTPYEIPLVEALARWILHHHSLRIPPDAWADDVPVHLRMRFEVVDEDGTVVAQGRDLDALNRDVGRRVESAVTPSEHQPWSRRGIKEWDFDRLPESVDVGSQGWKVIQYPGLVDDGDSVSLRLFDTRYEADRETVFGLVRLACLALSRDVKPLRSVCGLPPFVALTLKMLGSGDVPLHDQIVRRAVANACDFGRNIPRDNDAFVERIYEGKTKFYNETKRLAGLALDLLETAGMLLGRLDSLSGDPGRAAAEDIRAQLSGLFGAEFILYTPAQQLTQFPRYLKAVATRLDRLKTNPMKDAERLGELVPYRDRLGEDASGDPQERETYRWMLEEWRVSLFAQELGTRVPVSAKRLEKQWAKVMNSTPSA